MKLGQLLFTLFLTTCFFCSNSQNTTEIEKSISTIGYNTYTTSQYNDSININYSHIYFKGLEIPKLLNKKSEKILERYAMTISYNKDFKVANWVAYELVSEETVRQVKRTNYFYPDPDIQEGTAVNFDYKGSGFDKGHLAPAGDMGWNDIAMRESFQYSNIAPQCPSFNRGIWNRLEEFVRRWAFDNNSLLVVVGPVLKDNLEILGNGVAIPRYYYKVILDCESPDIKGIGFIFPNEGSDKPINTFAVSIDSVEVITGIDFFHKLPDEIENTVESNINLLKWKWEFRKNENLLVFCKYVDRTGIKCNSLITEPNQSFCKNHVKIETLKNQNILLKSAQSRIP